MSRRYRALAAAGLIAAACAAPALPGCREEPAGRRAAPPVRRQPPGRQASDTPDAPDAAQPRSDAELPRKTTVADPRIDESSGVAISRLRDGVFWTHNDSGDTPRLYAFDRTGRVLATVEVEGAHARDWEDMCSYRRGGHSYLLIGDTGDNAARRSHVTLYIVPEPKLPDAPADRPLTSRVERRIRLTYADGPDDCECVAVDPAAGDIWLVTKRRHQWAYRLPIPEASPEEVLTLTPAAKLRTAQPTGMDISPDGRRLALVTYLYGLLYERRADESWADALGRRGSLLPVPLGRQVEAVCFGPTGRRIYLTAEGNPMPLWELDAGGAE